MNTAIQFFGSTLSNPFHWGNSLWMDAIDDSIHIPYSPSLDFTDRSYTISCWTYSPAILSQNKALLVNWSGIDSAERRSAYLMGSGSDLGQGMRILEGHAGFITGFTGSGATLNGYDAEKWVLRIFQYDKLNVNGLGTDKFLYSRGDLGNISSPPLALMNSTFNTDLTNYSFLNKIWSINTQVGNNLGGLETEKYIDTLSFFDRALTYSEVLKLYSKGKGYLPTKIPNCVACYLFDETPGTAIDSSAQTPGSPGSRIILDHSGNGNHAYATGYGAGSVDFVDHFTLT